MKKSAAALLAFAAIVVGCGGDKSGSTSSTPVGAISPAKALEADKRSGAVPANIGFSSGPSAPRHTAPELRPEGRWYVMPPANARIAREPREGMQFQLHAGRRHSLGTGHAIPVDLADSASAPLRIANNRGLFFANTYPSTDTILTPGVDGVDLSLVLRGPSAPSKFSWRVVGSQTQLVGQPKSQAAGLFYRFHTRRVSGSGFALSIQVDPYPHDSAGYPYKLGTKLSTQLASSGDHVTVRIDHSARSLVYPLVVPISWQSKG